LFAIGGCHRVFCILAIIIRDNIGSKVHHRQSPPMNISQFYDDEPYEANVLSLRGTQRMERRESGTLMGQPQRNSTGVPFGNPAAHGIGAPPTSAAGNIPSSRKMQHPFQLFFSALLINCTLRALMENAMNS
ncbi:hypothetical protein NECAME_15429, partial [Necator americanus]